MIAEIGLWKKSLDLVLEDQDVMDYVQGKIHEPPSYFTRLTEIRNDLLAIGEEVVDRELVLIALGGLPRDWKKNFKEALTIGFRVDTLY